MENERITNNKRDEVRDKFVEYASRHYAESNVRIDANMLKVALLDGFENGFAAGAAGGEPVPMLLFCPRCFEQHVDDAMPDVCELCGLSLAEHPAVGTVPSACFVFTAWLNPPHKSHRCNSCNHVWRPADVPTEGVQAINSKGERDGSARPVAFANGKDFDDAVEVAMANAYRPEQPEVTVAGGEADSWYKGLKDYSPGHKHCDKCDSVNGYESSIAAWIEYHFNGRCTKFQPAPGGENDAKN